MKYMIVKNVYTEAVSDRTFEKELKKVAMKRPVMGIFLITSPLGSTGIMEIYDYNELLQPYYRKQRRTLNIYGVAGSKAAAYEVVRDIMEDIISDIGKRDTIISKKDVELFFGLGE